MGDRLKVGFISLGCPKNLVDTEVMLGLVKESGHELVTDASIADVIVVNTCCFIGDAEKESHKAILEFCDLKKEGKISKLIVTGCMPQRYKEELAARYPEVDNFLGSSDFHKILEFLDGGMERVHVKEPDYLYSSSLPRVNSQEKGSVYVKIAEGCSEQCTFCIVPKLRGRYRSRVINDIVKEAADFAQRGVKEVNLIAQNLTGYGKDLRDGSTLVSLLRELVKVEGLSWIRLIYNYPRDFTEDLLALIADEPKICRYVDLPIQHIDDKILAAMGRRTSSDEIRKLLDRLREKIGGLVVRTSFIVGFPGETEGQFEGLVRFVKEYGFDKIAIFPYSPEKGTSAYRLVDDIPQDIKLERYDRLMDIKKKVALRRNRSFIGKTQEVLVERSEPSGKGFLVRGRFYGQAPEVDGEVLAKSDKGIEVGSFRKAVFTSCDPYDFKAKLIKG